MIVQIGIVVGGIVESFSIDIERPLSHLLVEMVEELVAPARQIAGIDDADWGSSERGARSGEGRGLRGGEEVEDVETEDGVQEPMCYEMILHFLVVDNQEIGI